jgi:hypothetical protein
VGARHKGVKSGQPLGSENAIILFRMIIEEIKSQRFKCVLAGAVYYRGQPYHSVLYVNASRGKRPGHRPQCIGFVSQSQLRTTQFPRVHRLFSNSFLMSIYD